MPSTELLQGTLDLLILKALALGPNHGVGVAGRVQQLTNGTFEVGPGSLFPALHRLEEKGWLTSEWGTSENNRRAKYYEAAQWNRIVLAIARALEA
jgi:PadR family transcriptional regulator PadR